jgi:putative sigma-54 modulation protein
VKIKIAGRHTEASEALRSYVIEKTEALERFFDRIVSVDVVLSVEKERQIADFHAHLTNRKVISAREESGDMYASIDKAIDRLRRQLVKFKDQLHEVRSRGGTATEVEAATSGEESADGRQIIRTEAYFQKPMSPEEAALQLDAIEKEFLVFVNSETDQVSIIYHRRDGNFGLIEPRR